MAFNRIISDSEDKELEESQMKQKQIMIDSNLNYSKCFLHSGATFSLCSTFVKTYNILGAAPLVVNENLSSVDLIFPL